MKKNIEYKSSQISEFYKSNRMKYEDFYLSERKIIEKLFNFKEKRSVLDVGCACGGLGKALSEKFNIVSYCGIDINNEAIHWATNNNKLNVPHQYIYGDILSLKVEKADIVFSLSCADWNIETNAIIQKCWETVKDGGHLIISLRLTKEKTINDIDKGFQYIDFFNNNEKQEKASYTVFNIKESLNILNNLQPKSSKITAFGYYGSPSKSAVIPYDKLLFAVFAIEKNQSIETNINIEFPLDIFL